MFFFGSKIKKILLMIGVASLIVGVVWPFLRGGQPLIQTGFVPINDAMADLLEMEKSEPHAEPKMVSPESARPVISASPSASNRVASSSSAVPSPTVPAVVTHASQPTSQAAAPNQKQEAKEGRLNLNTATLEQLDKLPGIGESKAKAILAYRLQKGQFKRIEELKDVKGIGDKMFAKLRELVYVAPS
ncbi:ComEA family DNA-binding protein [Paenibacillus roseipurpureus]|uniref:Helix-hairpin-helix domain-containing protein n=1 Tax=Paenibacillus roseopurpureus TaxID=2918901 RepID=A0AA96LS85_9BACL|nr:helix-hairpin-helix domain-containing protein [Paenibacillus sp. MBLB1832]WNR46343.1 helix-hairpin-helix domain-containing protein [Paenibacillus sp. MBLB1832]